MDATRPVVYAFAISHYCEKARWALEHHGLAYDMRFLAPGHHRLVVKKLGAARGSLPVLVANGRAVQGSAAVVDWCDAMAPPGAPRLTPEGNEQAARELERRLDEVAGVHVRRYYYSEALVEHPHTVRPLFTRELPPMHKGLVVAGWGMIRRLMIKGMDLGFEQGRDSRTVVDRELSWLDDRLADGRRFLVGDRFSRADLAAASLLAPLVLPSEHPVYAGLVLPPRVSSDLAHWADRPSLRWVREIYSKHRLRNL